MLLGMWDLPGTWIEPMSPSLAGRFLSTAPPRKSETQGFLPYGYQNSPRVRGSHSVPQARFLTLET